MPRWKPLPDDLDPQIREFTGQLRRIVDRGGLGVAALADRTGYSRTSWERYLGGRLLAPLGAVVALAEATDTSPVHLTTMWELAERAWSRAESRHDRTMEQIRISQARAALGEAPVPGGPGGTVQVSGPGETVTDAVPAPGGFGPAPVSGRTGGGDTSAPDGPGAASTPDGMPHASKAAGVAGPAGVVPSIPVQPTAADRDRD
ncbi:helix-turn-helix transcriptional regulator, partial [Streptomyces sp. SID4985]|uniref:helix-turn-helix domain-containing protein n=1 Tax=Streptomyces sp. SID4985 TaxID=2690292 RepID=UPI001F48E63D